jgi:hypothetical protein
MSEILEAVACKAGPEDATVFLERERPDLSLALAELSNRGIMLYRHDSRAHARFDPYMDHLAKALSSSFQRSLVIRYDSRESFRASALYTNGALHKQYGREDEIFVPLDEEGEPVVDGPTHRYSELDPSGEYETSTNAIELGLQKLGVGSWGEIQAVIARL